MILYPDQFPVDEFLQAFRREPGTDHIEKIKKLYHLLENAGLAASIWETKIEVYDTPLVALNFPDELTRLIISFTKPSHETAHDLICTWCSPAYLDIYRLEREHVVGTRASASELHRDSPYRLWPRHMLPVESLSDTEKAIYDCSERLGYTVNQCLPHCVQLWNLPEDIIQIPVFQGLKMDGNKEMFAIRCALMFIDQTKFLAINDRADNAQELMTAVRSLTGDLSTLSDYICYLEVDLLPDNYEVDIDFDFDWEV